jgi:hypothetical protein
MRRAFFFSDVHGPENGAVSGLGERVDLDLCCVFFLEDPVQVDEDVGGLIRRPFGRKPKLLGDADSRLFCQASCEWYGCGDDRLGVLRGDLFDIHPALVRRDENDTLRGTVVENGNIVLVRRLAELS